MSLDAHFLRAQTRLRRAKPHLCGLLPARLFIRAPKLQSGSLPDRWSFHDEDLSRYAAPSNTLRRQAWERKWEAAVGPLMRFPNQFSAERQS